MFCKFCGKEIPNDSKFCPECGASLVNETSDFSNESIEIKEHKKEHSGKKGLFIVLAVVALIVIAIIFVSNSNGYNVKYIADRSIQYEEKDKEFNLLFSFKDSSENRIKSDAKFDIRIVNDEGETVFEGTKNITKDNFSTWTSPLYGDRLLGSIKIPCSEIKKGKSSSGTIYFTVSKDNVFYFDESTLDINFDLPIKDVQLIIPTLPVEVGESISYIGSSKIRITNIKYDASEYDPTSINITYSGEMIQKNSSYLDYVMFSYRVLDESGQIVDSGTAMTDSLNVGDKFTNVTSYVYNLVPGEKYYLELSDYK